MAKVISTIVVIALWVALYSFWQVAALYVKTAVFTILGGTLVVSFGHMFLKGIVEPVQDFNKTIGEVTSALMLHAREINSNMSEERISEASDRFRHLASELIGKGRVIVLYKLIADWGSVPEREDVQKAAKALVVLSNVMGTDRFDDYDRARGEVIEALDIKRWMPGEIDGL